VAPVADYFVQCTHDRSIQTAIEQTDANLEGRKDEKTSDPAALTGHRCKNSRGVTPTKFGPNFTSAGRM
jgi:hypothetical protein